MCPRCFSKNTHILSPPLIVFIPIFTPKTYFKCDNCGWEF